MKRIIEAFSQIGYATSGIPYPASYHPPHKLLKLSVRLAISVGIVALIWR